MSERPPWAEAVADIIDPEGWEHTPFPEEFCVRAVGLELTTRCTPPEAGFNIHIERATSGGYLCVEVDGGFADAAAIIRRCYAAALVASGNTKAALAALKGGSDD